MKYQKIHKIRDLYNATSSIYEARYTSLQIKKYNAVRHYLSKIKGKIIDLGCGTGLLLNYLQNYMNGKKATLVGSDISDKMILYAINRRYRKIQPRFLLFNAEYMPIKDNILDVILSFTMLQNVQNPKIVIHEIFRTIKENGIIIISTLKKAFNSENFIHYLKKSKNAKTLNIKVIIKDYLEDDIFILY